MYVISLFLILFTAVAARAATPSFSQGKQFSAISLQGEVTVYCLGGTTVTYKCFDTALDPVSYDYFVGSNTLRADQVAITCTRADGSKRDAKMAYDYQNGRSADAFNLWINTPFQHPLLAVGNNKVDYKLTSSGKIVDEGSFIVNVDRGAARTCPTTHYNSNDAADCESPYTVCQRYFEQYDNCR